MDSGQKRIRGHENNEIFTLYMSAVSAEENLIQTFGKP